jgi:hypothetical protein
LPPHFKTQKSKKGRFSICLIQTPLCLRFTGNIETRYSIKDRPVLYTIEVPLI